MRRKKSLLLPGHVQASRNALRTKHSVSMPSLSDAALRRGMNGPMRVAAVVL